MAAMALRVLGVAAVGGAAVGTTQYTQDEGFRRTVKFWTVAMPAYLHYRAVELAVSNRSPKEQEEAFARLHRVYAPKMEALVYRLRGFYLKLVQVGSTRDELLPEEYMRWAKKTQDSVPTELSGAEVRSVVEASIGQRIEDVFESFEDEPIGAASIGQVHRGVLRNGRAVAVKVQYPRIEERFRADIATSKRFAKLAQPQYIPFMEEVERQFRTEFDYRGEADNLRIIRDLVMPKYGSKVAIPEPVLPLCTKTVLVMDYLPGIRLVDGIKEQYRKLAARLGRSFEDLEREHRENIHSGSATSASLRTAKWSVFLLNLYFLVRDTICNGAKWVLNCSVGKLTGRRWVYDERIHMINLAVILSLLVEVHGYQLFECGSFNADPHPGNVLLCPDGRLGLIDYGQVKHLSLEARLLYAQLMEALRRDDREEIVRLFAKMGFVSQKMDPECLYRRACFFHDRDSEDVTGGKNVQLFMEEVNKLDPVVSQSGEFILVGRMNFLMRGMGNAFNLSLRMSELWHPFAQRLLRQHGLAP
mmetsp:Transcript_9192/g.27672  ORF Transcript_9192/g.27672 Transcript_9192/m.27672 type:complete len:530 (-) Transcript_9192:75-1664(-)